MQGIAVLMLIPLWLFVVPAGDGAKAARAAAAVAQPAPELQQPLLNGDAVEELAETVAVTQGESCSLHVLI